MKTLNLNMCGQGQKDVSLDEVFGVNLPAKTDSYQPVSHKLVLAEVKKHLQDNGFSIENEKHHLARFGLRYFGLMQVQDLEAPEDPDRATVVGVRNSYDKSFPAGLMCGDAPFVCSNLIFSNEIVLSRRHTSKILDKNVAGNIFMKIAEAVGLLREKWQSQAERVDAYKNCDVSPMQAHDLILRVAKDKGCSKSKILDVRNHWEDPFHPEFNDRNLYSLYNSFSEFNKQNLNELQARTSVIHGIFDAVAEQAKQKAAEAAQVIDIESELVGIS